MKRNTPRWKPYQAADRRLPRFSFNGSLLSFLFVVLPAVSGRLLDDFDDPVVLSTVADFKRRIPTGGDVTLATDDCGWK